MIKKYLIYKHAFIASLLGLIWFFIPKIFIKDLSPNYRYTFYIVLLIIIINGLSIYSRRYDRIFRKGWKFGAIVSGVTGLVILLVNTIIYFIDPELTISKFEITPSNPLSLGALDLMIFMEMFVFGNILTFIGLQWFKNPVKQ